MVCANDYPTFHLSSPARLHSTPQVLICCRMSPHRGPCPTRPGLPDVCRGKASIVTACKGHVQPLWFVRALLHKCEPQRKYSITSSLRRTHHQEDIGSIESRRTRFVCRCCRKMHTLVTPAPDRQPNPFRGQQQLGSLAGLPHSTKLLAQHSGVENDKVLLESMSQQSYETL